MKRYVMRKLALTLGLLTAVGCKTTPNTSKPQIAGSDEGLPWEDTRRLATANLLIQKEGTSLTNCTGVLVHNELLLTAAHCLHDAKGIVGILFGSNIYTDAYVVKPGEFATHPSFKFREHPNHHDFDIAWVKIDGALPPGTRPVAVNTLAKLPGAIKETTLTGFGTSSEWERTSRGYLNSVTVPLQTDGSPQTLGEHTYNHIFTVGEPGRGPCHGDSGGPMFIESEGQWVVAGLTHGVDVYPDIPISGSDDVDMCAAGKASYVAIAGHLNWIESTSGISLTKSPERPEFASGICPASKKLDLRFRVCVDQNASEFDIASKLSGKNGCREGTKSLDALGYCKSTDGTSIYGPFSKTFTENCLKAGFKDCTNDKVSIETFNKIIPSTSFYSLTPKIADFLEGEDLAFSNQIEQGKTSSVAKSINKSIRGKFLVSYDVAGDPNTVKYCVYYSDKDLSCQMTLSPAFGGTAMPKGERCFMSIPTEKTYIATCRTRLGRQCNQLTGGMDTEITGYISGMLNDTVATSITAETTSFANAHGQSVTIEDECPFYFDKSF